MRILFTADLHFTDLPRDEYRWGLLPWLAKQVTKYKVDMVVLGGDITDAKDKHSAVLVNRLVGELGKLAHLTDVVILRGNHDYIDENEPFFGFIDSFTATHIITFVTKPEAIGPFLFLPNTRNWEEDWKAFNFSAFDIIFAHATFDGALSETGFKLPGIPPSVFAKAKKVWSGDIHKPQKIGKNIEYVGAPYRCRFGDVYLPRVVLLQDGKPTDLHYPCKGKHLIEINNPKRAEDAVRILAEVEETGGLKIYNEDQIKVRVRLPRTKYGEWPEIKQVIIDRAKEDKFELTGPELVAMEEPRAKPSAKAKDTAEDAGGPLAALAAYVQERDVPSDLQKAGQTFLKEAMGD